MEKRKEILTDFYTNFCDEDTRLLSKHGQVEFLTTINYIEKYLKKGMKILEVGAGTGRYSLYFAEKGYEVNAIEYIEKNLDVLKSNIKENMNITAECGDAIDLSRYQDNSFDITLVLGPLYHLYTDEDILKAIKEAIRVTKKDGILFFAYLTNDSIMVDWALRKRHLIDGYPKEFDENFKMTGNVEGVFRAFYVDEFKNLMNKYNVEYLKNIATDGITRHVKDKIDILTDEEFNVWMRYHLMNCERYDLQGYSSHMLYICKKK